MFNLDSFVSDNYADIYKLSLKNLQEHDAKDLTQSVFSDFCEKFYHEKMDSSLHPRAYLFKLAKWRIVDKLRENNKRQKVFLEIGETNLESAAFSPEEKLDYKPFVRQTLDEVYKNKKSRKNKCSDRDCEIFRMAILEDKSTDEIAKILGTSKPTVYLARHRVGQQIKKLIKNPKWSSNFQF